MTKQAKQNLPTLNKANKRTLKSYIAQSYLFKKYSKLRTDTKEIVSGIFDKANSNIIMIDEKSYVQKINRNQRRFDSVNFIKYINSSGESDLIDLVNKFYKDIETVEFKPFHADYEIAMKKDLGGFDVK
jgi:transcriptional regulator with PAS, ATPase and Fis domain